MLSLNKKGLVFFFYLFFLLAASQFVCAIGISPADVYVNFVPNHEYVIDYSIRGYRDFEFYTEGAFSEFTRVETLSKSTTAGNFRVYLTLPAEYDPPGQHKLYVVAREKPIEGAVNTIAEIRGYIAIDVPYPGYYAEMKIQVNDVNEGEPIPINVVVRNKGDLNITDAQLQLTVVSDDKVLKTINSEKVFIEKNGGYTFKSTIGGDELKPGVYRLDAKLFYAGKEKEGTADFRVGTFDVAIVNYTRRMFNNSINLFEIEIESRWNNRIDKVFMDLNIKNGSKVLSTATTPPFDLIPWEKKMSSFYWNTAGIPIGKYDLDIVLHYDDKTRTENRKIYIVEQVLPEVETPVIPTSTVILLVIAVLLVIFNIYFVIQRRRKKGEEEQDRERGRKKS